MHWPRQAEAETQKPLEAPGFETGAFESLESDFQEVSTELAARARTSQPSRS